MSDDTLMHRVLVHDTGVSAHVGTRVYPELAARDAELPYITYTQIVDPAHLFLDLEEATFREPTYQIDIWSASAVSRRLVGRAVERALLAAHGGADGAHVHGALREAGRDSTELADDGTSTVHYRRTYDVVLLHEVTS